MECCLVPCGAHIRTMACWDVEEHDGDARPRSACLQQVGVRHWVFVCSWRHLFGLDVHTQLHVCLDTLCARWKRHAVSPRGIVILYGPDVFAISVGSPGDDDPHPGLGMRTLFRDPSGDWEAEDLRYLYDRGLVVGAAQRVLAAVINVWDGLDRKQEMPIVPAAREVYYQDGDGRTWDLAIWVPASFDLTSYAWGMRLAIAGVWPAAGLLWSLCERGRLSARLPPGQLRPPDWAGAQRFLVLGPTSAQGPRALGPQDPRG